MSARILLVDDEPMNLALLEALLLPSGYELVLASDGEEAMRFFDAEPFDLVLLDYVMPGVDGLGVLAHIRGRATTSRVPVVLITAHADRPHRLRGLQAGADEFLEKPIDSAILMARVKTLLALKASQDALARSKDELEQRHQAVEQARRDHKELTEFIVHDLKSPLSAICANLEFAHGLLQSPPGAARHADPEDLASAIGDSRLASQRLTTMIADLLAISRMEDSAFLLHREEISVTGMLRAVIQSYVARAREKGIALTSPPELDLRMSADRTLMLRVLENILDNAFRYTPERGHISVATRTTPNVEILVSNDGPGIPMPQRHRIFDKFRRGSTEAASRSNAGLGLYFCKRAVEAHGGAIDVVDSTDFPTTFRISLPR
ncbi:MAG: response regulator [Myxococcales bacterium]